MDKLVKYQLFPIILNYGSRILKFNYCVPARILAVISYVTMIMCCMKTRVSAESVGSVPESNRDMYIIHAMVYQIGIVTNRTDNDTSKLNTTGDQETLTLYYNNGSNFDLSGISQPILTNVTAQDLVGVAPVSGANVTYMPWSSLNNLTSNGYPSLTENNSGTARFVENVPTHMKDVFKRDVATHGTPVKIVKGSAVIPEAAGVRSVAIPPLLTLNNNFSEIPVPIPNTAVVRYAKVNTLINQPLE